MEGVQKHEYSPEEKLVREWFVRYLEKLRGDIESGELSPEVDWDTIWVISGPEYGIDQAEAEDDEQNQSEERLHKGLELARAVTAKRLDKQLSELTIDDVREHGPLVYYNGGLDGKEEDGKGRAMRMREALENGVAEEVYDFPLEKILFTSAENEKTIKHTGDQFDKFPTDLLASSRKVIAVSSWYHCPRLQRYVEQKQIQEGHSDLVNKIIVYPADIEKLRIGRAVGEAKKVWKYFTHVLENENEWWKT